ncbi:hypothetical protein BKA65DRAFT_403715 [Rhexocercosporidium sp. MPI-PUGE-AT-0058]|nr:hypothetical protein BKA65DRAFT_403715 [Rhexocercosporidium sp. MPI-PUGE-AT-0058]
MYGQPDSFAAYFASWFDDQCSDCTGSISKMTIASMLEIINLVRSAMESRQSIHDKVLQTHQPNFEEDEVEYAITLAARLWSASYIDASRPPFSTGQTIEWTAGPLPNRLAQHFQPSSLEKGKLPSFFTAKKLDKIGGIKIQLTGNLLDHLKMTSDDTAVYIFHQVSFLGHHVYPNCTGLPKELVEETIRTLALLLPGSNGRPNKWYEKRRKGHEHELDPVAGTCGFLNASNRRLENFKYWGLRLAILKQAFDDSEPKNFWHWWRDDRKKVQWYTFWIAVLVLVLTVVFGLIQSVAGVVQTVVTVKSANHS